MDIKEEEHTEHESSDSDPESNIDDDEFLWEAAPLSTDLSDDDEEEETPPDRSWRSKNGEIQWEPTNDVALQFKLPGSKLIPGPSRYAVSRVDELIDSFDLFFTPEMTKLVADRTNLHGRKTTPEWKDIDVTAVRAYFGVLLLAGVYRSRNEETFSLWDDQTGRHIFRATMSVKTFMLITKMLRFEDGKSRVQRRGKDELAAIREVWDTWTVRLPAMFNPAADICVDEQPLPYRGHELRRRMPMKQAGYGLRMWVTCDVQTSYVWRASVDTGQEAGEPAEQNPERRVMLDMTEGLKGATVTCSNFFSSYELAEELLRRKIAMVGAVHKRRPELPRRLWGPQDRKVFSSVFAFTKTHTLVSYIPKQHKHIVLLSTKHRAPEISSGEKREPQILADYNRCKGGVDAVDELISTYSCRRRSMRWPLTLFYYMLDISALNAFTVWTGMFPAWNQGKSHRRRLFLEELGRSLVGPQIADRQHLPKTPGAAGLVKDAKSASNSSADSGSSSSCVRRQCVFCPAQRRVYCTCSRCGKHVCKQHHVTVCQSCFA